MYTTIDQVKDFIANIQPDLNTETQHIDIMNALTSVVYDNAVLSHSTRNILDIMVKFNEADLFHHFTIKARGNVN